MKNDGGTVRRAMCAVWILGTVAILSFPARAAPPDPELVLSSPALRLTASALGPRAVDLADIDADGSLDAVVVGFTSARYACYRGLGDGTFGEEFAVGGLYQEPVDLVVDDFNGDGLPDIAAINSACDA